MVEVQPVKDDRLCGRTVKRGQIVKVSTAQSRALLASGRVVEAGQLPIPQATKAAAKK